MRTIVIDEIQCNGCGSCIPQCKEGAIKIVNGKAQVVASLCDGAGACIGRCPQGAISFKEETKPACGCPGTQVMSFQHKTAQSTPARNAPSELSSWPVQLRLVPALAPFLENADLLIAADCVPCAYPDFHAKLLKGKVLLVGCPKFDDLELYREKLGAMVTANTLRSITYAHMEVPCCLGLKPLIEDVIGSSGKNIPFHEVIVSVKGELK